MSLSNLNEIDEKIKELTIALREDHDYAYVCGYMESFFSRIVRAYVPANRHHELIELLDMHLNTNKEGE